MRIPREQFDRCMAELEADHRDPRVGFFGPGTESWRLGREGFVMLGGWRAALLQAAHPYVAWAVSSQSAIMTDVAGRFQRTFENVFGMTFGPKTDAIASARRVRMIHEHVHGPIDEDVGRFRRGDTYEALDADATLWVAATLFDTEVLLHELVFGEIAPARKEFYYAECKRFLRMFGLDEASVPATWNDLQRWIDDMLASDTIAVGRAAELIFEQITRAPRTASRPAYRWLQVFTAGLMPPDLREDYGLQWRRRDRVAFRASLESLRAVIPALPDQLRYFPQYLDARRRIDGRPGRDPVGERVERFFMAGLKPSTR